MIFLQVLTRQKTAVGLTRHLSVFGVLMAHLQLLITPCLNASSVHVAVQVSYLHDLRKLGGSSRWGAGGDGKVREEAWKSKLLNGQKDSVWEWTGDSMNQGYQITTV